MTKPKKKSGISAGKVAAIGAGVAALGAGAYYFLGPNGKKNQKKVKGWMMDVQTQIMKKVKAAKKMTEPMYNKVVDGVIKPYLASNAPNAKEIKEFAEGLKKQWKMIAAMELMKAKKTVRKAKTAVKKATKKKVAPKKKK